MGNFYHGTARCSGSKFWCECFTQLFEHISGSTRPITLIWASLERSFPPAEIEYKWCQFFWSKVMTSEVEERPRLVTASYGRRRSQWVKDLKSLEVWKLLSVLVNPFLECADLESFHHQDKYCNKTLWSHLTVNIHSSQKETMKCLKQNLNSLFEQKGKFQ